MPLNSPNRNSSKSAAVEPTTVTNELGRQKAGKNRRLSTVYARIMALEFVAVAASAYFPSVIYQSSLITSPPVIRYIFVALFIAAVFSLVSAGFQHFDAIQMRPLHLLLWNGIGAVGLSFSTLLSVVFLLKIAEDYSRGTFLFQIVCVTVAVLVVRTITYSWIRSLITSGAIEARHVILIGEAKRCVQFSKRLKASAIQTVGSFRLPWLDGAKTTRNSTNPAGQNIQQLIEACRALGPDDIILLAGQDELPKTMGLSSSLSELPVGVHIIPVDALDLLAGSHITEFGSFLTIQVHRPPLSRFDLAIKRSFDVFAATVGLIVFSPLFLIVSIAIKIDSRGPIFFRQMRHGFNNEPIRVIKFRTMFTLEDGDQVQQVVRDDPRLTRLGRMLRRANLDELPQLLNVLRGNMSMVGPRPHATAHNNFFQSQIAPFSRRHTVKPGLTGWAQVNGFRGETDTLEKMQRRVEHDLYYIDNWSFLFDIKIILLTLLSKRAYANAR
jgi:Undecaprenyl-phosphate glucose phosphotransferase